MFLYVSVSIISFSCMILSSMKERLDKMEIYRCFLLSCTSLYDYYKEVMRVIQYIGVLLFFFLVSCEKNDVEPQKTRTLMVYLAGDNNLSGHMQKNITSMMSAWKESYHANIVIYFENSSDKGAISVYFGYKNGDAVVQH